MNRVCLNQQFATRLRSAMIAAGLQSSRSNFGVDIQKLAEITGHSTQICRKYLRGVTLPEPIKLMDISMKLNVSPGWLLFGDNSTQSNFAQQNITISINLLRYVFIQANELFKTECTDDNTPDFLTNITRDVSQINANEEQSKKIIDLALASARRFKIY